MDASCYIYVSESASASPASAVGDAIRDPVAVSIAIRGRNGDVR